MSDPAPPPEEESEAQIKPPEDVPPVSAESLVDGEEVVEVEEERRYPSTIGGAFFLACLALTLVGLVVAWLGDWRIGIRIVGSAVIGAGVVRLLLRPRNAGMLAVRTKWFDVPALVLLGAALWFLASSIPDQPGF